MLPVCLLLLAAYAAGLTRDFAAPWTGMHDWNGAFFSQLARNLLRYPWEIHHGMPVVAVGEHVPPSDERSIYASHPPGLVWLVAASFSLFGESEWAARLVPVAASLVSLLLLMSLVQRRYGNEAALLTGLAYAVMPLSVFYGRMVDHEAVCLAGMLAAMKCWQLCAIDAGGGIGVSLVSSSTGKMPAPHPAGEAPAEPSGEGGPPGEPRLGGSLALPGGLALPKSLALVGTVAAIVFIVWIDWSGLLFAALFCAHAVVQRRRRATPFRVTLLACAAALAGTAAMLGYLVYVGLGSRWGDLLAIFMARAGRAEECRLELIWRNTLDNFTWPVLVLAVAGLLVVITDCFACRRGAAIPSQSEAPARGGEREDRCDAPLSNGASGQAQPLPDGRGSYPDGRGSLRWAAPSAMPILAVTGLLWLALFPRQYQVHGYWAFYLGPVIALLAAVALRAARERLARRNRQLGRAVLALGGAVVIATGIDGVARFHGVRWFVAEVESYRAIHNLTAPGGRLILFQDPIRPERHGGYYFRNITPPHLAYYLDRAFDVDQDFAGIAARTSDYAGFVIPMNQAVAREGELRRFLMRFPAEHVGAMLYIRF